MIDINHVNPMNCEISPPNNGPKKYAMLTLTTNIRHHQFEEKKMI